MSGPTTQSGQVRGNLQHRRPNFPELPHPRHGSSQRLFARFMHAARVEEIYPGVQWELLQLRERRQPATASDLGNVVVNGSCFVKGGRGAASA